MDIGLVALRIQRLIFAEKKPIFSSTCKNLSYFHFLTNILKFPPHYREKYQLFGPYTTINIGLIYNSWKCFNKVSLFNSVKQNKRHSRKELDCKKQYLYIVIYLANSLAYIYKA